MSSKEILSTAEDINWTPAANISLHHVQKWIPSGKLELASLYFKPSTYRSALRGKYMQDWHIYDLDAFGRLGSVEHLLQEEETKVFFEMLNGLSDNTVIQLDSGQDGLCAACPVGKHCSATNYTSGGHHDEAEKSERKALRRIRKELLKKGFQQEIDFKLIEAETTMLDYQSKHLWTTPIEDATPITVVSDAMLLKMGALRQIAEIGINHAH